MKRNFYCLVMAAFTLLATSCSENSSTSAPLEGGDDISGLVPTSSSSVFEGDLGTITDETVIPTDENGNNEITTPTQPLVPEVPSDTTAEPLPNLPTENISSSSASEIVYEEPTIVLGSNKIVFNGAEIVFETNNCITLNNNEVIISCAGEYELSGASEVARVVVSAGDLDEVTLVLNGLNLKNGNGAVFVQNADKVEFKINAGTVNEISDGPNRTETVFKKDGTIDTLKAAIYAKDDIQFKGSGTLIVNGNYNNGIQTSNDIKIKNGAITVNAKNHGVKGKGSVVISGGELKITTQEGDGIKSDEGEDENALVENKGMVRILGGHIEITAADDGISAYNYVYIADSTSVPYIYAKTGTGTPNTSTSSTGMGGGMGGGMGNWGWGSNNNTTTTTDDASLKGIKAGDLIVITAGNFEVAAEHDAIHSNNKVQILGGDFTLSGRNGAHADDSLIIRGGNIKVSNSYEVFESRIIVAAGGNTYGYGTNDGWNVGTGNEGCTGTCRIVVNGGTHYVKVGSGDTDGIDSNDGVELNGGVLVVEAANVIFDVQNTVTYNGGIFMGFGSSSENTSSNYGCTSVNANTAYTAVANGIAATFSPTSNVSMALFMPATAYTNATLSGVSSTADSKNSVNAITTGSTANGTTLSLTNSCNVHSMGGGGGGRW